jgi:hypothetical protein
MIKLNKPTKKVYGYTRRLPHFLKKSNKPEINRGLELLFKNNPLDDILLKQAERLEKTHQEEVETEDAKSVKERVNIDDPSQFVVFKRYFETLDNKNQMMKNLFSLFGKDEKWLYKKVKGDGFCFFYALLNGIGVNVITRGYEGFITKKLLIDFYIHLHNENVVIPNGDIYRENRDKYNKLNLSNKTDFSLNNILDIILAKQILDLCSALDVTDLIKKISSSNLLICTITLKGILVYPEETEEESKTELVYSDNNEYIILVFDEQEHHFNVVKHIDHQKNFLFINKVRLEKQRMGELFEFFKLFQEEITKDDAVEMASPEVKPLLNNIERMFPICKLTQFFVNSVIGTDDDIKARNLRKLIGESEFNDTNLFSTMYSIPVIRVSEYKSDTFETTIGSITSFNTDSGNVFQLKYDIKNLSIIINKVERVDDGIKETQQDTILLEIYDKDEDTIEEIENNALRITISNKEYIFGFATVNEIKKAQQIIMSWIVDVTNAKTKLHLLDYQRINPNLYTSEKPFKELEHLIMNSDYYFNKLPIYATRFGKTDKVYQDNDIVKLINNTFFKKALFVFNDNSESYKSQSEAKSGNAVIRSLNLFNSFVEITSDTPHIEGKDVAKIKNKTLKCVGIPTGFLSGPKNQQILIKNINEAFKILNFILMTFDFDMIVYSVGSKKQYTNLSDVYQIGASLFLDQNQGQFSHITDKLFCLGSKVHLFLNGYADRDKDIVIDGSIDQKNQFVTVFASVDAQFLRPLFSNKTYNLKLNDEEHFPKQTTDIEDYVDYYKQQDKDYYNFLTLCLNIVMNNEMPTVIEAILQKIDEILLNPKVENPVFQRVKDKLNKEKKKAETITEDGTALIGEEKRELSEEDRQERKKEEEAQKENDERLRRVEEEHRLLEEKKKKLENGDDDDDDDDDINDSSIWTPEGEWTDTHFQSMVQFMGGEENANLAREPAKQERQIKKAKIEAKRIEQEAEKERERKRQEVLQKQKQEAEKRKLDLERIKAEQEAKSKAEAEARQKAEAERRKIEAERRKAEADAKARSNEEARLKAEADAKARSNEEARLKEEEEAKKRSDEEARLKADAERKRKEAEARTREEADAKTSEEARLKALADAKTSEEARLKAEADAKTSEEARLKAVADAEAERKRKGAEAQSKEAEMKRKEAEAEIKRKEAEAVAKASTTTTTSSPPVITSSPPVITSSPPPVITTPKPSPIILTTSPSVIKKPKPVIATTDTVSLLQNLNTITTISSLETIDKSKFDDNYDFVNNRKDRLDMSLLVLNGKLQPPQNVPLHPLAELTQISLTNKDLYQRFSEKVKTEQFRQLDCNNCEELKTNLKESGTFEDKDIEKIIFLTFLSQQINYE